MKSEAYSSEQTRQYLRRPVQPGAEHRSDQSSSAGELEWRRRRNALRGRECGYDPADPSQRLLMHYTRKLQWSAPVTEARSLDAYQEARIAALMRH